MKTTKMMEQIVRDMEFKTRWDVIFESELKRAGYFTLLQSDVLGAINRYGEVIHSSILVMTLSLVDEYSELIHDVHGLIQELIKNTQELQLKNSDYDMTKFWSIIDNELKRYAGV